MRARERSDTSSWFGLPRWIALCLVAGLIVAAGFLIWVTAQSFTRSDSLDERRVRALDIAADYIAKWPDVATTIAQTSLYYRDEDHRGKAPDRKGNIFFAYLFHPDFGDFRVEYDRGQARCQQSVDIYKNQLTVRGEALGRSANLSDPDKGYIQTARDSAWIPLGKRSNPVCFTIEKLDLAKVAPPLGTFSHLLLIADTGGPAEKSRGKKPKKSSEAERSESDRNSANEQQARDEQPWRNGRVVAWVGSSELPIRRLSDLPALQSEVSDVVAAAEAAAGASGVTVQPEATGKKDALQPFDSRVAGKSYRFYWRPIALDIPGDGNDASGQPVDYYLVGVAPSGVAPEQGQSRTELLAFAVVLFMLIAIIPVMKLALLGPVDSMQPIEVAAIGLGIVAATALGTSLWIGVRDVVIARTAASSELMATARSLTRNVERDLRDALFSPQMRTLSEDFNPIRRNELVAYKGPSKPRPVVQVENTILLDDNGRQAANTIVNSARDHVGANFDLSDRIYFRRAVEEDFAPSGDLAWKLGIGTCDIWRYAKDGLVFDQIRSRADGAPKTIVAAKLNKPAQVQGCPPPLKHVEPDKRLQPSSVVATFVTWRMLSPRLDTGVRYAVVDLRRGAAGRPVLFHSDSYRAGVELFDESLDGPTRARLSDLVDRPHASRCDLAKDRPVDSPQAQEFTGVYEQEATLFAVDRVPCTDWAVVTFKSRRLVDSQAVKPAVQAILVWASLAIVPYLLWMVMTLAWEDRAWVWLWPDPRAQKKKAYRDLASILVVTSVLAVLLIVLVSPFAGALFSSLFAFVSLAWLGFVHYKSRDLALPKLDHVTERRFVLFVSMLLVALSVVPVAALAADARGYFAEVRAAQDRRAHDEADGDRRRLWAAIAHMEGAASPIEKDDSRPPEAERCVERGDTSSESGIDTSGEAGTSNETRVNCPQYFTQQVRNAAGYERGLDLVTDPPAHSLLASRHEARAVSDLTLVSLALVVAVILGLAIWASMRGLFGFGIALEAIDYPQLPLMSDGTLNLRALPPRFLVISANETHLQALKDRSVEIDLNDAVRNPRELKFPARSDREPVLLLITNLGLLLGDPTGRRQALELLERIVAKQESAKPEKNTEGMPSDTQKEPLGDRFIDHVEPSYLIAILTSLTPLERVLQSFDRERDEMDQLGEQERLAARLERAKHREDMRWSALFEKFTTFYYASQPRAKPPNFGDEGPIVELIWRELEYLPDGAVSAMVRNGELDMPGAILVWARDLARRHPEPGAVIDFLTSNLIEHYHLVWSLSSRAERLLLYRIAFGHVPNVERAYALRSLVKRGLVVLDPYPRTMNKSFAQFVRHVEKPETIKNWRRTQEHGFWDAARLMFGLALPIALAVLILAALRNGESIASIVPLLVAAFPALIHAVSAAKRTAAA